MEKGLDVRGILREAYEPIDKIAMMSEASLCEWQWEWEFQKEVDGIVFQSLIKTLRDEWQWEQEFQKEVDGIVFQSLIKTLRDEWQWEQEFQKEVDGIAFQSLVNTKRENFQEKAIEFSSLREDLNAISRSLFSAELPKLLSHGSLEGVEESPNERKDGIHGKVLGSHLSPSSCVQDKNRTALENSKESENTMSEVMECPQLKHMTNEEITNYFKTQMTDMKIEHEMKVQEMTEVYYSFKREFIKEQRSSNLRKDNDIEALRKKIPEVILKLDNILVENEKSSASCDDYENICCLKDRVNSLLSENRCLKGMLIAEKREVKSLSLNLSDAAAKLSHHSMAEANFLKQIKKLECDMEDVNIESFLTEDIFKCVLREFTGQIKCDVEDTILSVNQNLQDMLIYITKVVITLFLQLFDAATKLSHHSMAEANFLKQIKMLECDTEDANIESFIREDIYKCVLRDLTSQIKCAVEDSDIQDILVHQTCPITFIEYVRDAEATVNLLKTNYNKEKERGDLLEEKLLENENTFETEKALLSALLEEKEKSMSETGSRLTEQIKHLELVLHELNRETNLINSRLDEAFERIDLYEVDVTKLDQKLKVAGNDLREAKREGSVLHGIIQEKKNIIQAAVANEVEQRKKMESSFASIQGLEKSMVDFECRVMEKIMQNCSRLNMLDLKCRPFAQQANLLKRKGLEYKQKLERRCSNLEMAEKEVDLLADKVDVLLSLLSKIYTALDRYSLILQNYPGIMEVLNLVRRELKKETN
ncbi:WPP domain-associated protein-like [Magnolia sinica]|uniref:WPP domain-associated protein-like n=1 Tax=Magnolia sinica TaxID=86752 RepID=UPI00265A47E0|nr:WPP domain-associated protein-like [Magnolia sinica]